MQLDISEDRRILQDHVEKLLRNASTPERIRSVEPLGFDPSLWAELAEFGLFSLRAPTAAGGMGMALLDALLVAELLGRHLASVPAIEAMTAAALLARIAPEHPLLGQALGGEVIVTLALQDASLHAEQLVPGGGVSHAILAMRGSDLVLLSQTPPMAAPANLGGLPLGRLPQADGIVLVSGDPARDAFDAAMEEWRLLTAAAMAAAAHKAIENAAAYAGERILFGKPIGSFQGVAHALADSLADVEGAQWLARWGVHALARETKEAAQAASPMAFWWAATTCSRAVERALHVFGGYGLAIEYDAHLYFRRVRGWALAMGDPASILDDVANRLWRGAAVALPESGDSDLDFSYGDEAEALAAELNRFFEAELTPQVRANAHFSFEGHDWTIHRKLAQAALLFPSFPPEYGGRGADRYAEAAATRIWEEQGYTRFVQSVANIVAHVVMWFGSAELKEEVLPRIIGGEIACSLGFSEPQGGSDVFSAKVRSIRDGGDWIIDGQKMWTSGAEWADFVLLLTRSDSEGPKHAGLTMFLVPLKAEGVSITPIHTFQDERTNATFYDRVRISDRYRIGEIGGGTAVMASTLKLEQGGQGSTANQQSMISDALLWARAQDAAGHTPMDNSAVRARLAQAYIRMMVSDVLTRRGLWHANQEGGGNRAYGPMSKLFATEAYKFSAADLADLTGATLRGRNPLGRIETHHRRSIGTTIYGGVSEVHRSMVAEVALGMPRSRT